MSKNKKQVDKYSYIDVGVGAERYLRVSRDKMETAIKMLGDKAYQIHLVRCSC